MRAHCFQHVPFEGLGSIEPWLKNAGYELSTTCFFNSSALPNAEEIDFLIILGGPMSVNDEAQHPWLSKEKKFIKRFIETGKPVLGVCLGAQLIATAMGAVVFPNPEKEIGWFFVEAAGQKGEDVFQFPNKIKVFHWHGETFSLPQGAVLLARSQGCENQAFQIGRHVIGLQFHIETTPESARRIVENCKNELVEGAFIQSETEILSAPMECYTSINALMADILDYLHANTNTHLP